VLLRAHLVGYSVSSASRRESKVRPRECGGSRLLLHAYLPSLGLNVDFYSGQPSLSRRLRYMSPKPSVRAPTILALANPTLPSRPSLRQPAVRNAMANASSLPSSSSSSQTARGGKRPNEVAFGTGAEKKPKSEFLPRQAVLVS
jgi:hypothetical protein